MVETFYPNEGICPNCNKLTWLAANGVLPYSHRTGYCKESQDTRARQSDHRCLFAIKDIRIEPDEKNPQQFIIAASVVGDFWDAKEHIEEVVHDLLLMLAEPHN